MTAMKWIAVFGVAAVAWATAVPAFAYHDSLDDGAPVVAGRGMIGVVIAIAVLVAVLMVAMGVWGRNKRQRRRRRRRRPGR